jgi:type I restriction enzyme S subunit
MTGSVGQKRVPAGWLRSADIPLPEIDIQREVVGIINTTLPRVRSVKEQIDGARKSIDRFRSAVLTAACSGKLTKEDSTEWHAVTLGDVITDIGQGWSPRCDVQPSSSPTTWGVIKTTAIQPMRFIEVENKRLPDKLNPRESLEIHSGDLLITRAGPRDRAGVCCLVRSARPKLILCDKAYRFHADGNRVIPDFVELVLNEPNMQVEIDKIKTGISDSGLNLTQSKFLALQISIPTLDEQREIIKRVHSYLEVADRVELRLANMAQRCDRITESILREAFAGGLC